MTVRVQLPQGLVALIDDEDAPNILLHRWFVMRNPAGTTPAYVYARRKVRIVTPDGSVQFRREYMHRVIIGAAPGQIVDHRNRDGLDNRRANLRIATKSLNGANASLRSDSTNRFRGVLFNPRSERWQARITKDGAKRSLGAFATDEDAARAYDAAARQLFGEFAGLNFPGESS